MKLTEARDVELLKLFIALRDRRAERKSAYNADDASDRERQDKIENEFLRRFNDQGTDSVSANNVGTAYMSTRPSATVGDWDKLLQHIIQNNAWELLEHRANKIAVEQFKAEHDDLPPGVNWSEMQVVNFRRQ